MRFLLSIARAIDTVNRWVGRAVAWLVPAAVLVSAGNAVARYAFNTSSNAWLEIQWYLFSAVFLLCAGYTLLKNSHVRIDVLSGRLTPRARAWIDIAGGVFFLLPMAIIVLYLSWPMFLQSYLTDEMSSDAGGLARWYVKALIPAGFALLVLQGFSEMIKRIAFLRGDARIARRDLMQHEIMAPLMFGALVVFLLLGYPVAFSLAANGILFALIGIHMGLMQPELLQALPERIFGIMRNETLLAIPFFTFMGLVLERSGMAEELLDTIGQLFGAVRGGLAYAVVLVGALLAATTGVVAASVISMGLISLPIMMRYGYSPRLAAGVIAASGTLAQIIPPSLVLIVLADQLGRSVGDMYRGAMIPGLVLAVTYMAYVAVLSVLRPAAVPALPAAARTYRGVALLKRTLVALDAAPRAHFPRARHDPHRRRDADRRRRDGRHGCDRARARTPAPEPPAAQTGARVDGDTHDFRHVHRHRLERLRTDLPRRRR